VSPAGRRPAPHVPGKVNRASRAYANGATLAEHVADVRPGGLDAEYRRHVQALHEADTDPARVPYPGEYDGFAGFAERAREILTERN
jgi:hypothetical protein